MTRRFYFPADLNSKEVVLSGDETHHMTHVMRHGIGDSVCLFNGMGEECTGRIAEITDGRIRIEIESVDRVNRESPVNITIAFSIPKGKRSSLLVQKCAELGVKKLIPLQSERSIVKLYGEGEARLTKWRKVIVEASKQCGRNTVTDVTDALAFDKLLETAGSYNLALVASPSPDAPFLKEVLKKHSEACDILCLIGPEGGFTDTEMKKAINAGCLPVGLGIQTLRIETAAIAISAMLTYAYSK